MSLPDVMRRYTFGEKVQGTVRVKATLRSVVRRESFVFYDVTAELVCVHVCVHV